MKQGVFYLGNPGVILYLLSFEIGYIEDIGALVARHADEVLRV